MEVDPPTKKLLLVAGGKTFTSTGVVPLSARTSITVCATGGTSASWTVWLNGVRVLGPTTASAGTTGFGRIQLGDDANTTATVNFDRLLVSV